MRPPDDNLVTIRGNRVSVWFDAGKDIVFLRPGANISGGFALTRSQLLSLAERIGGEITPDEGGVSTEEK